MPKLKLADEGAAPDAITAPATMPVEADPALQATIEPKTGSAVAVSPPAVKAAPEATDVSFPSQHVIYLGVVRNQLEADLMRFRNGHEMLAAKLSGQQTAHEDEMRSLKDEYERKRQERLDTHLSDVTRLKVQIGDIADVIETYETAIGKVGEINQRQTQIENGMQEAMKP